VKETNRKTWYNIKMNLLEVRLERHGLRFFWFRIRTVVNTVMNLRVPKKCGKFLD
jgi:hypothetical protein